MNDEYLEHGKRQSDFLEMCFVLTRMTFVTHLHSCSIHGVDFIAQFCSQILTDKCWFWHRKLSVQHFYYAYTTWKATSSKTMVFFSVLSHSWCKHFCTVDCYLKRRWTFLEDLGVILYHYFEQNIALPPATKVK